jgi:hypothetical protein
MPGNNLRLLALDGGGVRGLSTLMILEQLMEAVDPDAPPKPCDYCSARSLVRIGDSPGTPESAHPQQSIATPQPVAANM